MIYSITVFDANGRMIHSAAEIFRQDEPMRNVYARAERICQEMHGRTWEVNKVDLTPKPLKVAKRKPKSEPDRRREWVK